MDVGFHNRNGAFEPDSAAHSTLGYLRDTQGGYPGAELSRGTAIEEALRAEKSKAGPAGIILPWFLPYHDDLTQETSIMRREYRVMLRDENVKAAVLDKVLSVGSMDLTVQPDGEGPKAKRVADFIQWNLTRRLKGKQRKLLETIGFPALIDGYSIAEKVWRPETKGDWQGKWILRALKGKDSGNDLVLLTDEYRNIHGLQGLRYNPGKIFSPAHFVIANHLSLFETPTGMSDFRAAYRAYWLIDTVLKLRAIGREKRAWPYLVGEYATIQQKPSMESALTQAKLASWLVIPKGAKVTALDVAGSADPEFADFIKDQKHAIFLGICGAILQALEGSISDGRGNSMVHRDTADLFKWYLANLVEDALNDEESGLVPDMVDLNFSGAGYPLVTFTSVDLDKLQAEANLDKTLHETGLSLSRKEMYKKYNRTPPEDTADTLAGDPPKSAGSGGAPGGSAAAAPSSAPAPAQPMAEPDSTSEECSAPGVYLIRHGKTALNSDGQSPDRIRGWIDVPLDATGRAQAQADADQIAQLQPAHIYSSDLERAAESANYVAERLGLTVEEELAFRPWNLGIYQGRGATEAAPIIAGYSQPERADEPVPGGESFASFRDRFLGRLQDLLRLYAQDGRTVAVFTHFRCLKLVEAWLAAGMGRDIDAEVFARDDAPTGSMFRLYRDAAGSWQGEQCELPEKPVAQVAQAESGGSATPFRFAEGWADYLSSV